MEYANNVIVIGGCHHNTLGVVRALGERGIGVELITVGREKERYVSSSRYVTKHQPLVSVEELTSYLLYRPVAKDKEVVISCADNITEHLNEFRDCLASRYTLPGCEKEGRMLELMDKTVMIEMASARGLEAPKVWRLPEEQESVTFPCITKSYVSSHGGKADVRIFRNKQEFDGFVSRCSDGLFVQPFIEKKEEVQFIGCSLRGGDEVIIPGMSRIVRSQPNTNTGFLKYGPVDEFYVDTVNRSKQYIRDCGYSGLFSIEFIRSKDDEVYFLEINFRNDGNAWCVTAAGVNLPVIWTKACLGIDYKDELKEVKSIMVMPEFQDFKLVLQHKVGLDQWLKDVRRTDAFLDWNRKDKRPFFRFVGAKLRPSKKKTKKVFYLIRLDDACPTMDAAKWNRMETILDRYGVKPMVGIIPHNEDPMMAVQLPNNDFWDKVRVWQDKGWVLALHGYSHKYQSFTGGGINPFWKFSEFCGVPLESQKEKIRQGVAIMRTHGINPQYFFAPGHTFDENTLTALREESDIRIVSDGIAFKPYKKDDFIYVPQIFGHCVKMSFRGIYTFCFHPNAMKEIDFQQLESFLQEYKGWFVKWDELNLIRVKRKSLTDMILSWLFFTYRKIRGLK